MAEDTTGASPEKAPAHYFRTVDETNGRGKDMSDAGATPVNTRGVGLTIGKMNDSLGLAKTPSAEQPIR